jgi:hypothetical protein
VPLHTLSLITVDVPNAADCEPSSLTAVEWVAGFRVIVRVCGRIIQPEQPPTP